MNNHIKILLVDDHPPLRAGIRALLEQNEDIEVVGEASDGAAALAQVQRFVPTVTVLDCELPDMHGADVAAEIVKLEVATQILALSAFNNQAYIQSMVAAGAKGYLLKNETSETIIAAVRAVAKGESYFSASVAAQLATLLHEDNASTIAPTAREQDVLSLLADGMSNGEIGRALHISERTVAYHIENLLNKLSASNRTEAVVEAIRQGWLDV